MKKTCHKKTIAINNIHIIYSTNEFLTKNYGENLYLVLSEFCIVLIKN